MSDEHWMALRTEHPEDNMTDLARMEAELAELQAKVATERQRVRETTLEAIRAMLVSGTLTADDLRELLPKAAANPNRRKPGPKPTHLGEAA